MDAVNKAKKKSSFRLAQCPFCITRADSFGTVLCIAVTLFIVGCGDKFFDPTQVGRFRPKPAVNVILDSLGVAPETPSAWAGAEEPKPIDIMEPQTDYVLSAGDIVRVSIFELLQEGSLFISDYVITESGKISIPEVGVIQAEGLTETQLEEEIRDILEPTILKNPSVSVRLVRSDHWTFSILGNGLVAPGRYFLPRYRFTLADALATAGGISEFNVSHIYVTRKVTGKESEIGPIRPELEKKEIKKEEKAEKGGEELKVPDEQMLELIKPHASSLEGGKLVVASAEMAGYSELTAAAVPEGLEPPETKTKADQLLENIRPQNLPSADEAPVSKKLPQQQGGRVEWIFQDGKWVPVQIGGQKPVEAEKARGPVDQIGPVRQEPAPEVQWEQIGTGGVQTRVIDIPVEKFQSGDPRYNIVIWPGDIIYVPVDIVGEFFITGNVNRQGAIPLTGRPMTLKMAIAAAGGLGPLAWPKRCEVIRRLGTDREEIVMVDLDKIFSGEQPDFFIKVNDLINVGTHPTSRWRAVLRNAFRATYGFGFVYDRNFADRDFGTSKPFGSIVERIEDLF